ncbi:MAG: pilus assembly FimT family protein [Phycisphaerales bacterium]
MRLACPISSPVSRARLACPGSGRRAFTVVETLAVIGAIAVLLAITVPTMSSMRASARSGKCQSNLRQLGVAATSYALQNRDRYPAAILYELTSVGLVTKAWDFEQRPDGTVRPGAIWEFVSGSAEVQQCPEFEGASTFGGDPYTGYNYNTTYIGAEGRFPELGADGRWRDGWKVARHGLASGQHRRTTTTALFGDGGWRGGANKFMRAPSNAVENDLQTVYAGAQAFRHGGCTHVCYLDGHVAGGCACHEGSLATPELLHGVTGFPQNGFLADGDSPYDPR